MENDGTIERALEDALSVDPRVSASRLAVSAAAGVVTLIGVVSTPEARRAAEDDAWNTKGARGVVNRLEVGRSR